MATHSRILAWRIPRTEEPLIFSCMAPAFWSSVVFKHSFPSQYYARNHSCLISDERQGASVLFVAVPSHKVMNSHQCHIISQCNLLPGRARLSAGSDSDSFQKPREPCIRAQLSTDASVSGAAVNTERLQVAGKQGTSRFCPRLCYFHSILILSHSLFVTDEKNSMSHCWLARESKFKHSFAKSIKQGQIAFYVGNLVIKPSRRNWHLT